MKVVLGSDAQDGLVEAVAGDLKKRGYELILVGPPAGDDQEWAEVGRKVGETVARGDAESGVLFCWTGTGASIAANKVPKVRAALCTDKDTAAGARKWNDANVLVMSLRLTSPTLAGEMLDAWFSTSPEPSEAENIARLEPSRFPQ
jgi:ribose 5-phosphate isomerase B